MSTPPERPGEELREPDGAAPAPIPGAAEGEPATDSTAGSGAAAYAARVARLAALAAAAEAREAEQASASIPIGGAFPAPAPATSTPAASQPTAFAMPAAPEPPIADAPALASPPAERSAAPRFAATTPAAPFTPPATAPEAPATPTPAAATLRPDDPQRFATQAAEAPTLAQPGQPAPRPGDDARTSPTAPGAADRPMPAPTLTPGRPAVGGLAAPAGDRWDAEQHVGAAVESGPSGEASREPAPGGGGAAAETIAAAPASIETPAVTTPPLAPVPTPAAPPLAPPQPAAATAPGDGRRQSPGPFESLGGGPGAPVTAAPQSPSAGGGAAAAIPDPHAFGGAESQERAPQTRRERFRSWRFAPLVEIVATVALALGLAETVQAAVVKPFVIPSESMEPTLLPGQRVLVNRLAYDFGGTPARGDIVVFHPPSSLSCKANVPLTEPCPQGVSTPAGDYFVKRVMGLPGDVLSIRDGHPVINGKELANEPYINACVGSSTCNMPHSIVIPKGEYYMLGDNRGDSDDSRYWGPVPISWIIGQVFATYWPINRIGIF